MPQTGGDSQESGLERFVNKTVDFTFSGRHLQFRLSHALFSSFDIDEGTRLLLKSVAQKIDLGTVGSAIDLGCGVGVIGICIAARAPHVGMLLQDRDALAVAFARANCRLNGLARIEARCGLAFWGLGEKRFDLVVSNLPAKAGAPVLASFFRHAAARMTPTGLGAVVIVAPLADAARGAVGTAGCTIVHEERTSRHLVIHFVRQRDVEPSAGEGDDLSPYVRARGTFERRGVSWNLETVYSLPDFDTLGHPLEAAIDLLSSIRAEGRVLLLNPGQGHLAAFLARRQGNRIDALLAAGRDALELAITARNIRSLGRDPSRVMAVPFAEAMMEEMAGHTVNLFCAVPSPIPRVAWQPELAEAARALLAPGGRLFVVATSTEIHRFLSSLQGFRLSESGKHLGWRAVLLVRS